MLKMLGILLITGGSFYASQSYAEIICRGQFGRSAQEAINAKAVDTLNMIADLDDDLMYNQVQFASLVNGKTVTGTVTTPDGPDRVDKLALNLIGNPKFEVELKGERINLRIGNNSQEYLIRDSKKVYDLVIFMGLQINKCGPGDYCSGSSDGDGEIKSLYYNHARITCRNK